MYLFLADENFPPPSTDALRAAGFDVVAVRESGRGSSDEQVLEWADREGRILVTFDTDFGQLIFGPLQKPLWKIAGIVLFRDRPRYKTEPADLLATWFASGTQHRHRFFYTYLHASLRKRSM